MTIISITVHPAAELFPVIEGAEFDALVDDIRTHGQRVPIVLHEGQILDGRNRYRACQRLDIEPITQPYVGDSPTSYVWSCNGVRRQLTRGQLALIAADMLPLLEEEAHKRLATSTGGNNPRPVLETAQAEKKGKSVNKAAAIVGVGKTLVQLAKNLKTEAPDLAAKVKAGQMTIGKATRVARDQCSNPNDNGKRAFEDRADEIRRLAAEGHVAAQIAAECRIGEQQVRNIARRAGIDIAEATKRVRRVETDRVIEVTVSGCAGLALGLSVIQGSDLKMNKATAKSLAASLAESMAAFSKLKRKLNEVK